MHNHLFPNPPPKKHGYDSANPLDPHPTPRNNFIPPRIRTQGTKRTNPISIKARCAEGGGDNGGGVLHQQCALHGEYKRFGDDMAIRDKKCYFRRALLCNFVHAR